MNPVNLASHAVRLQYEFQHSRHPSFKFHSSYLNDYLEKHFLTNASVLSREDALKCALTIFSVSAFIDWKLLGDIDSTCAEIVTSAVVPLNNITRSLGFSKREVKNLSSKKIKKILFLSQMDLLSNNGAAAVSRDIVFNFKKYVEPGCSDIELQVGSVRSSPGNKALAEGLGLSGSKIKAQYFSDLESLTEFLGEYQPDLVIFDYFQFPVIMLPYSVPGPLYLYLSHGFVPLVLDNVDAVLVYGGLVGKKTLTAMREASPRHLDALVSLPMPGMGAHRIDSRATSANEEVISKMAHARAGGAKIAVTLCRKEKISSEYLRFLEVSLRARHDLVTVCAGPGVGQCEGIITSDRAWFSGAVDPMPFLANADVYIETFPEHQGLSPIDAMRADVPVVSLNNNENPHLLLSRRPASGIFDSTLELRAAISSIIDSGVKRDRILVEQAEILRELERIEADFWPSLFKKLQCRK